MGLGKSKEDKIIKKKEKKREKELKKESKVAFFGKTLQPIGHIPAGTSVILALEPKQKKLIIRYEKSPIALPYERIISFILDSEDNLLNGGHAGARALAGGILFGAAGAVIGAASAKNKSAKKWIGVLSYKDKEGNVKSLNFLQDGFSAPYDGKEKHYGAAQFEATVNNIIAKNSEIITEL